MVLDRVAVALGSRCGLLVELALELVARIRQLTERIRDLLREITGRIKELTPTLLTVPGCGPLGAAKIVGETADVRRFSSKHASRRTTARLPCRCGRVIGSVTVSAGWGTAS